jgi:hypothetical protein
MSSGSWWPPSGRSRRVQEAEHRQPAGISLAEVAAQAAGKQRTVKVGWWPLSWPSPAASLGGRAQQAWYAWLFRYDDEILVNPHAYGDAASANPTLHLRRLDGGTLADRYMASVERVWASATPWSGGEI